MLWRKLDLPTLAGLGDQAVDLLHALTAMLDVHPMDSNGAAAHSGRHHTDSNPDFSVPEPCQELAKADLAAPEPKPGTDRTAPKLPLHLVVKACPDVTPMRKET